MNIHVKKGEVHGIIGKNGAGKSTLVSIIAGLITPDEGEIEVDGKQFSSLSRIAAKKENIAIVPQEPQVILDLTVAENLFIPNYGNALRLGHVDWKQLYRRAEELITQAGLNINVHSRAGDLTVSERQLLLVIKACYVEDARIIIFDEASASLAQNDEALLYGIIEKRKNEGKTIIFISHRTDELLKLCDRLTVLRDGSSIATVDCSDLDLEKLSSLIVGGEFTVGDCTPGTGCREVGPVVLQVENLTRFGVFHDISFTVREGEILGIAGLRGSGRTEIFRAMLGIDHVDSGTLQLGSRRKPFSSPADALKHGLVYLPEDREHEGLINNQSVRENLVLNAMKNVARTFWVDRKKEEAFAGNLVEDLSISTASLEQEVSQLSGGNKQKVVVGRIAAAAPKVFILDEPTRGVDISAKKSILRIVQERLSASAGVIITSPGLEDLIQVCDRILVLHQGFIVGEYKRDAFSEDELYQAIQGGCEENTAMKEI
ncbi:MAG: sugar ABC transporter ATP-binding protein [Bacillota bacterium]|nr:sugar ABC transporter ATP-binding protein [Bacillota bacterium]MDW7685191.1 sugar ABC transporter ATP-binding protein [Bacillota bacterium]